MRLRVLLLLLLTACKRGATSAPSSDDASLGRDAARSTAGGADAAALGTLDGPALYTSLCAVCHGADATGYKADNAPSLVNRTFLESASDEQLRRSIADGRPGTSMAAYSVARGGPLDDKAVARIVTWIRAQGPAPIAIPPRIAGDAARGAPLYAANCERCHGNAKARGYAVQLSNPRFLEVASDAFLGWAIAHGRPGTPMEAWQGRLTDAQIDDVVAYVRGLGKPPVAETLPAPTGKEPIVIHPRGAAPTFKPRSTPCAPKAPCTPDERFISVDQVKQALDQKRRIVIIDARPPSDWMRVHIAGAVSIPYHDLKRLDEIPNDGTWVIAYCACPHHLSGEVVDALRKRGVRHAAILDEGIFEWQRRGYPVVAAPGVEAPVQQQGLMPPSGAGDTRATPNDR
ncbi:MAG: Cytochrome c oxidase subunit CcoP [Labilithrix sp.]|nr:Cytochrome c oxidase subunit CcoP [Labilithrix sp.]